VILYGVKCERVEPITPEAYVCRWQDRNTLALGLLSQCKGTRISVREAIEGAPGIVGRPFAVVEVESYGPTV
jgi:hypothetical protein